MRSGGAAHKIKAPQVFKKGKAHKSNLLPLEGGGPRQRWRLAEPLARENGRSPSASALLFSPEGRFYGLQSPIGGKVGPVGDQRGVQANCIARSEATQGCSETPFRAQRGVHFYFPRAKRGVLVFSSRRLVVRFSKDKRFKCFCLHVSTLCIFL